MKFRISHAALVGIAGSAAVGLTYYASNGNPEYSGIAGAIAAAIVAGIHSDGSQTTNATPPTSTA